MNWKEILTMLIVVIIAVIAAGWISKKITVPV